MSEKWWALRVKRTGDFFYLHPDEVLAHNCFDEELMKDYDVVPVRVIEDDAKPCEWELSPFGEASGEPNTKTWLNFITDFGYKYCPQCGRSLEER